MADTVRQCWAYNKEGQRCDHPAGHPGNHVIMAEWTDEECFSPIQHQLPKQAVQSKPEPPMTPISPKPEVTNCVACQHKHRGGECKCGCYEFIG